MTVDFTLNAAFDRMDEFENQKRFGELSLLCEEYIQKHPLWPTPHLFLGSAASNEGDIDTAIRSIQYFLDNAPSDPSYGYGKARTQAKEWLGKLKSKKKNG